MIWFDFDLNHLLIYLTTLGIWFDFDFDFSKNFEMIWFRFKSFIDLTTLGICNWIGNYWQEREDYRDSTDEIVHLPINGNLNFFVAGNLKFFEKIWIFWISKGNSGWRGWNWTTDGRIGSRHWTNGRKCQITGTFPAAGAAGSGWRISDWQTRQEPIEGVPPFENRSRTQWTAVNRTWRSGFSNLNFFKFSLWFNFLFFLVYFQIIKFFNFFTFFQNLIFF